MRILHLALTEEWEAARGRGRYTGSTLGRDLREVGFVHCAYADQWQQVRARHYAEVTDPLVLLVIETDLLDAPVVDEAAPGSGEMFPHVYGAIGADAVVEVLALPAARPAGQPAAEPARSFSRFFLAEMLFRSLLGLAVLVVAGLAGTAVQSGYGDTAALWVALASLLLGTVAAAVLVRRRDRRLAVSPPAAR